MPMSNEQNTAFETANVGSSSFSPDELQMLISGLVATVIIIWYAWLLVSAYKSAGAGKGITFKRLSSIVMRGMFVLVVTLALVTFM